jgi:uncharacterized membrane protein (DUF2068 family)
VKIDWTLVVCGTRGHVLAGRDAARITETDAHLVRELGERRWHRCLRCDSWIPLMAPSGPARDAVERRDEIELPLRGRALRDRVVLRLIACDRALHFLILGLLGIGALLFANHENNLRNTYYRVLTAIQGGVAGSPVQTSGHVGLLHELDKVFTLRSGTLHGVAIALLAYALLEGVEAVGLWRGRRWAEYLTFIATTVLLPLEVYELTERVSALKIIGFLINLAVVVYLIYAKRLFGLRGGGAADEAEREQDSSWEAVERTTPPPWPA